MVHQLVDEVGDRGLAVGARDAAELEGAGGVSVEALGQQGGDERDVGGKEDGEAEAIGGGEVGVVGEDGDRAGVGGVLDVAFAVGLEALAGDEEGARDGGAAVFGDVAHATGAAAVGGQGHVEPGDEFG